MSPEHLEIKEQRVSSLIMFKNRQLSFLPLNFDCSRIWQWTVKSTTVTFVSESMKLGEGEQWPCNILWCA